MILKSEIDYELILAANCGNNMVIFVRDLFNTNMAITVFGQDSMDDFAMTRQQIALLIMCTGMCGSLCSKHRTGYFCPGFVVFQFVNESFCYVPEISSARL